MDDVKNIGGNDMTRRNFIEAIGMSAAAGALSGCATESIAPEGDVLDTWQRDTDLVTPEIYYRYLEDGDTRGFRTLENLESGFAKALKEIEGCEIVDTPAVWHIYNIGYLVKTKESLFSIDLNHRREVRLAPELDFALITHNHGDHFREPFYQAMNGAKKSVISNFKDNYGAADWRKGGSWYESGGYTRAEKTFHLKDVEIRTALTDHNKYLVDFTTTFEIRVGDWKLFHSGDCRNSQKLKTVWGEPDVWLVFPGCGIDFADAYKRFHPKRMVFGHLWEPGHSSGRLTTPMVKRASEKVSAVGGAAEVPLWGERIV